MVRVYVYVYLQHDSLTRKQSGSALHRPCDDHPMRLMSLPIFQVDHEPFTLFVKKRAIEFEEKTI